MSDAWNPTRTLMGVNTRPAAARRAPAGRAAASAPVSDEMAALAGRYGIDPAALSAGFQAPDQEPTVLMGKGSAWRGRLGGLAPAEKIMPLSEAVSQFYSWDDATLRRFQEEAFSKGLLGTDDRDDVRWGDYDAITERAWEAMVRRSAGFYAQGKEVTPWDALKMSAPEPNFGVEPEGPERAPLSVVLSNPDDLRRVFQAGARRVLGRKVDDAELNQWIASFQSQESSMQAAAYGAQETGGTVTRVQDAETFAAGKAAELDPVRADARKVVGQFDSMIRMLGEGGVMNADTEGIGTPL